MDFITFGNTSAYEKAIKDDKSHQSQADKEGKIIISDIRNKIYLPENFENIYPYCIGMLSDFNDNAGSLKTCFNNASIVEVKRTNYQSDESYKYFRVKDDKNIPYIYRYNDEFGYYINDEGTAILISYSEFSKKNMEYNLIGAFSVLDFKQFKQFKPISFDFDKNLITTNDENTVFSFNQIGFLKKNKIIYSSSEMFHPVAFDLIAFDEFLKEKKYYIDDNEKRILNSYSVIINKYRAGLDEVGKSYYFEDCDYIEVLCENNEIFKFPNYLFPLLKNCPFNCSTIFAMKNHTSNPIQKLILSKVVKILEFMIHKPNINIIDLLKINDTIDLNKIGMCADYIGAEIIKEFVENI